MKHQITKAAVLRLKDFKIIIQNSSDMQHQLRCGQACIFFSPSLSSLSCFLPSCYFLLSDEDVGHCFLAGQPAGGMVFSCVFSSHTCSSLTNQLMIFKNQLVLLHSTITVVNRPPFFFLTFQLSYVSSSNSLLSFVLQLSARSLCYASKFTDLHNFKKFNEHSQFNLAEPNSHCNYKTKDLPAAHLPALYRISYFLTGIPPVCLPAAPLNHLFKKTASKASESY